MELIKDYDNWLLEKELDINQLNEDKKTEYQKFFKNKLQDTYGHTDLNKLSKEDKKNFFNDIGKEWKKVSGTVKAEDQKDDNKEK